MEQEKILQDLIEEIIRFESEEVNFIEAVAEYVERHDIDEEIMAQLIKESPILWSKFNEAAIKRNIIKAEHATLPL